MPKKRVDVSLRKPSPTPESAPRSSERGVVVRSAGTRAATEPSSAATASPEAVVEAFVNGAAAALDASASGDQSAKLQDLLRRGPDGYRELTVYLPEGLARDLSLHCLRHSLDMNRLVAAAVEKHLQAAGLASERRIRETARLLLDDVAAWVRAAWAARRQARAAASAPTSVGSPAAV
jgi:hypothetical protein